MQVPDSPETRCAKRLCFSRTSICWGYMLATAKAREREFRSVADTCASGEEGALLQGTLLLVRVAHGLGRGRGEGEGASRQVGRWCLQDLLSVRDGYDPLPLRQQLLESGPGKRAGFNIAVRAARQTQFTGLLPF